MLKGVKMINKNLKIVAVVDAINFLSICVSLFIIANALDFFIRLEKEEENPQETEKDDETTES